MQELKAEKPTESPAGTDVVTRLMARLAEEGFATDQSPDEWEEFGEIIFKRDEKISIAAGETVFIFTRIPELNERILRQTSDAVVHTYTAKSIQQKVLSVLQSTTVYHCLVCTTEQPYSEMLDNYVIRRGGATFIPVILVPEINQALYPMLEEGVGTVRPRIDYLQYLLGERRETVNMHRTTVQAFYVSIAVVAVLLIAIGFSFVMH
ncbi:MAG TPA: hypothetical protein VGR95_18615 [Thermoanaerobaculia bacterium]|jgi:hypothetical protein|nr:hypothetical protein [Thermoanaerobaculia bacterium]